jgi:hypothetical protein
MKPYRDKPEPRRDYFRQGFWLGLFFGAVAALFIVGKSRIKPKEVAPPTPAEIEAVAQ